jgi:predicted TPR repeat methyltransferase
VVLDLGCGTCLAGTAALKQGASRLICQDLNADVLRTQACATIAANCGQAGIHATTLIAGPWHSLAELLANPSAHRDAVAEQFATLLRGNIDLLLGCEILYSLNEYEDLVSIIRHSLRPDEGLGFIATKRFYYGDELGGSTASFMSVAQSFGLDATVVSSVENGASMIRDIIALKLKR